MDKTPIAASLLPTRCAERASTHPRTERAEGRRL